MLNWFLGSLAVLIVVAGCGNGNIPPIAFPADGQTIFLGDTPQFQVTLSDNDYQDVSLEIRGAETVGTGFTCQNGVNSPAGCFYQNNFGGGFQQSCTQERPCLLVIIARRGTATDVRTVKIVLGRAGGQQP